MTSHVDFAIVQRTRPGRRDAGSAVAASAYNACACYSHDDRVFDFTRKRQEHVAQLVLLPNGSPPAFRDPEHLWRAAEIAERRADAQTARQVLISVPRGVPADLRMEFVRSIVETWIQDGMAAQVDLHNVRAADGEEQPHAHVLLSLRRVTDGGFASTKERRWNADFRAEKGRKMRSEIERRGNAFLRSHDLPPMLDYARRTDADLPPEPQADREAWQRWKRSGADPARGPPTVRNVLDHRTRRASLRRAEAEAHAAHAEAVALTARLSEARAASARPPPPPPQKNKETNAMPAAPATRKPRTPTTTPARPVRRTSALPNGAWAAKEGGWDALTDRDRTAARAAYEAWAKAHPKPASRYGLESYVSYIQEKRAQQDDDAPEATVRAAVAPQDRRTAESSRVEQREQILAGRYVAPEAVAPHVTSARMDRDAQVARLSLKSGGELHDHGDRVVHHGDVSDDAAAAIVAAAAGHGWQRVAVTGSSEFREAVSIAAALRDPPIATDYPLSDAASRRIAEERGRRAAAAVRPMDGNALAAVAQADPQAAARQFAAHVAARAEARAAGRPTGSTDPAVLAAGRLADLRVSTKDAREQAQEARQAADAHRAEYPMSKRIFDSSARRRQAALDREASRLEQSADRAEKREPRQVRQIQKAARAEAMAHARAAEDWRWSPAGRAAARQERIAGELARAIDAGDPATVAAASKGDLRSAAAAAHVHANPAIAARDRVPGVSSEDADCRRAVAFLLAREKEAQADPERLASVRRATAAVVGGDREAIRAAAGGDVSGAVRAGEAFRAQAERDRAEKEREREQVIARMAARAANDAAGPAGP